jgi:hypothetical protein
MFAENEYSPTLNQAVFISIIPLSQRVTSSIRDTTVVNNNNNGALKLTSQEYRSEVSSENIKDNKGNASTSNVQVITKGSLVEVSSVNV